MAVTVSIPTILRTHTGGEKSVEASGKTVLEVIDDIESRHSGIKGAPNSRSGAATKINSACWTMWAHK